MVAGGGVAVVVAAVWAYAHAVPPLHPDPQQVPSVAASPAASPRWADAVDKARQIARAGLSAQNLPGLSVAVGVRGQVVWAEGFGWADIEKQVPVSPTVRFRIGHASKALTSAGVGLLRDRARLHIDDEIQTYVPEYPRKPWPVTLRQLMGHTAGLGHYQGEEADIPSGHCERASDGLRPWVNDPLLFEPGTESRYSTYGWILVSAAVEAAAGEPFFAFMRTEVFEPLGMTKTTADSSPESAQDRATFYFPRFSGDNDFGHDLARPVDYSCFAGAGGFLSTPSDLVRFGMAMHGGMLLEPATARLLQTRQLLPSGRETDFGLGWTVETMSLAGDSTLLVSQASRSLIGAATSFLTFPERGIVVAATSNTSYARLREVALEIAEVFGAEAAR